MVKRRKRKGDTGSVSSTSSAGMFSIRSWSGNHHRKEEEEAAPKYRTRSTSVESMELPSSSHSRPAGASRGRRRSLSLPKYISNVGFKDKDDEPVTATLSAVSDIEKLAQKAGVFQGSSEDGKYKVYPDFAYPNTRLTRDELRVEMNLPSAYYHNLRQPSKVDDEIGLFYLEILQCFGLPRFDYLKETSAFCIAVSGAHAFKTDVMPPLVNPMWLSKMRRACVFPIYYAYQTCSIGVFNYSTPQDGFAGRIGLKISQFRPGSTYDVTLPLRLSTQVYNKQQRGSIRIRFHLYYHSEAAAVWSYIPRQIPKFQPNESVVVNCTDAKSFQNVARVVHGVDMQSKFSMSLAKAVSREVAYQQIHILRYLQRREIHNVTTWKYPIMSAFVFCSWMHCVIYGSIRYLPGHLITYLLMHLWKNYGTYCLDGKYDNGFMAPTFEEMLFAMFQRNSNEKKLKSAKRKLLEGREANDKDEKKHKPCIEPLEMERTDPDLVVSALNHFNDDDQNRPATLEEIAKDFRRRLPTDYHTYWLKTYQNTFIGADAVSFLVREGYAEDREKAVALGRKLAKKFKLFQHIVKKHDFEDDKQLYYRFLTLDKSEYVIKTHKPWGKGMFRALNFRCDPAMAREQAHIEFPFASAADHPRFTVKDSLILRSKQSRALMETMQAEKEELEAVNAFGVGKMQRNGSRGSMNDDKDDSHKSGDKKGKKKHGKRSDLHNISRESITEDDFDDNGVSLRRASEAFGVTTVDPTVMIERQDSLGSVETVTENDPKYEIKILPQPPNQDLAAKSTNKDKGMAQVMLETRHKMHMYFLHVFNDRAFKLDMPKVGLGRNSSILPNDGANPNNSEDARKSLFTLRTTRKTSMSHAPTRDPGKDRAQEEELYLSARKDEYDRLLGLGKYAHANPLVNKIAVFVQPMIEVAQIGVFFNRSLFNIMTWRDPFLSFWVVIIGTLLVIFLNCFPWQIFFGTVGVILVGPQNWAIRIAKEKAGYEEPNFDMKKSKKKVKKEEKIAPDEPLFSSLAPDNRIIDPTTLDGSNIRPVAVPVTPVMYHRFYDWPPEPDYARVKAGAPPQNDPDFAEHLESLEYDPVEDLAAGAINSVVKPVTRWMKAIQSGKKAVKGVSKGVSKVQDAAVKVPGAAVKGVVKEAATVKKKIRQRRESIKAQKELNFKF